MVINWSNLILFTLFKIRISKGTTFVLYKMFSDVCKAHDCLIKRRNRISFSNSENEKNMLPLKGHNLVKNCPMLIYLHFFRIRISKGTTFVFFKMFSDVCEAHNRLIKRHNRMSFSQLFLHCLRIAHIS